MYKFIMFDLIILNFLVYISPSYSTARMCYQCNRGTCENVEVEPVQKQCTSPNGKCIYYRKLINAKDYINFRGCGKCPKSIPIVLCYTCNNSNYCNNKMDGEKYFTFNTCYKCKGNDCESTDELCVSEKGSCFYALEADGNHRGGCGKCPHMHKSCFACNSSICNTQKAANKYFKKIENGPDLELCYKCLGKDCKENLMTMAKCEINLGYCYWGTTKEGSPFRSCRCLDSETECQQCEGNLCNGHTLKNINCHDCRGAECRSSTVKTCQTSASCHYGISQITNDVFKGCREELLCEKCHTCRTDHCNANFTIEVVTTTPVTSTTLSDLVKVCTFLRVSTSDL